MPADDQDPAQARIQWLLNRVREGSAVDAELEELSLYAREEVRLHDEIERGLAQRGLGAGWLERVQRDQRLQAIENARGVRAERIAGLVLIAGGVVLGWLFPVWPSIAIALGTLILVVSFVRVRIKTHREDPYRDVMQ